MLNVKASGFFPWGTGGPLVVKILTGPPNDCHPRFLTEPVPPTEICPPKLQKFYLIFLSILTTF